jgi:hypothetical protein
VLTDGRGPLVSEAQQALSWEQLSGASVGFSTAFLPSRFQVAATKRAQAELTHCLRWTRCLQNHLVFSRAPPSVNERAGKVNVLSRQTGLLLTAVPLSQGQPALSLRKVSDDACSSPSLFACSRLQCATLS